MINIEICSKIKLLVFIILFTRLIYITSVVKYNYFREELTVRNELIFAVMAFLAFWVFVCELILLHIVLKNKKTNKEQKNYPKPEIKQLNEEQIKEIHAKGKITPEELLNECESIGICAPGDAIGSAGWRCMEFGYNCHYCLIDYANSSDEHESIYKNFKICNKE